MKINHLFYLFYSIYLMKNIKLNQCIICFFAFLIIAILIYKIITIEKFQTSTTNNVEVDYSNSNDQFGVNGINTINLTQPGVYVIARPDENIDLSAINEVDTYDYIIRLRNRTENNGYDLNVNDTLIIKSDMITVIGNSTISEESIKVPDAWTGFIINNGYDTPGFSDLVFKNIHIECLKDRSLADPNYCSRINYNEYGSLVGRGNGGIFKYDFGFRSRNLRFENLSFKGNIGAGYIDADSCEENSLLQTYYCGGVFASWSFYQAQNITISNLEVNGDIHRETCGGIFGCCSFYDTQNITISNIEVNGDIHGYNCGGIFGYDSFKDAQNITISNLKFVGDINEEYCGGIFGKYAFKSNSFDPIDIKISNCLSESIIFGKYCGGIFGSESFNYNTQNSNQNSNLNPVEIKNCIFKGTLIGAISAGIMGSSSIINFKVNLINCHSYCDIISIESSPNSNSNNDNINAWWCSGIIGAFSITDSSINIIECSYEGTINGHTCAGIIGYDCGDSDSNIYVKNSFCKGSFDINICRYNDIVDSSSCNQFKSINDLLYKELNDYVEIYFHYINIFFERPLHGVNNGAFCTSYCNNITFDTCYSDFVSNINITELPLPLPLQLPPIFSDTFNNSCFLTSFCNNIQINNCFVVSNVTSNNNIFAFCSKMNYNITIRNSLFNSNNTMSINQSNAVSSKAIQTQPNLFLSIPIPEFENVYSFNNMNEFRKLAERTILVGVSPDTWYLCSTPWKLMWEAQLDKAKETSSSTNPIFNNSVTLPSLENCEALGLNIRCSSTQN